jgi:hypothetical protein
LLICEVDECGECYIREIDLRDMKKQIQDAHANSSIILYLQIDSNELSEVSSTFYFISEVGRFVETRKKEMTSPGISLALPLDHVFVQPPELVLLLSV